MRWPAGVKGLEVGTARKARSMPGQWAVTQSMAASEAFILHSVLMPSSCWPAGVKALEVRAARKAAGVVATFKRVDTCAAEFEAATPYMYSSYDGNDECDSTSDKKVRQRPERISQVSGSRVQIDPRS